MKIEDLLVDFDEMGFAPTTLCENPEEYACDWKRDLIAGIERLKAEGAQGMNICENAKNCYYSQKTADLLRQVDLAFSEVQFQKRRCTRLKKALHTKNKNERIAGARKFADRLCREVENDVVAKYIIQVLDKWLKEVENE